MTGKTVEQRVCTIALKYRKKIKRLREKRDKISLSEAKKKRCVEKRVFKKKKKQTPRRPAQARATFQIVNNSIFTYPLRTATSNTPCTHGHINSINSVVGPGGGV